MSRIQVTRAVAIVLRVFLDAPAVQRHGYELMQLTGYPSGKIYPILARLLAAGWLEAEAEEEIISLDALNRPPRRLYRLSEEGARVARQELAALHQEIAPSGERE